MRRVSFAEMDCSVARTLDIVGEWWTMLIVRDAFLGVTRFDHFQRRLGIARNVLAARLDKLVDAGVLERLAYQERPPRYDYRLTAKGRDLWPVLTTLREWGDRWARDDDSPPMTLVHTTCGERTHIAIHCDVCGEQMSGRDVKAVGRLDSAATAE